jgi:hypothetical protein
LSIVGTAGSARVDEAERGGNADAVDVTPVVIAGWGITGGGIIGLTGSAAIAMEAKNTSARIITIRFICFSLLEV